MNPKQLVVLHALQGFTACRERRASAEGVYQTLSERQQLWFDGSTEVYLVLVGLQEAGIVESTLLWGLRVWSATDRGTGREAIEGRPLLDVPASALEEA